MMSAPALLMEIRDSYMAFFSSSQPLAAAALIIAYSPLHYMRLSALRILSFYPVDNIKIRRAGFTIIISAPSATSRVTSLRASSLFAGSI